MKAKQHIKRNLVIFVTARLVNPGGQLVNSNEDTEESEDLIELPSCRRFHSPRNEENQETVCRVIASKRGKNGLTYLI